MTKRTKQIEVLEVPEVESVEAVEATATATARIVTLANGEVVDFGVRTNLLTTADAESGIILFKLFSGQVISWDVNQVTGLEYASASDLAKQVIQYGLLAKIKTNLASVMLQATAEDGSITFPLFDNITKQIATLNEGSFLTRSSGSNVSELSLEQKAFANAVTKHHKFAELVSLKAEDVATWVDTNTSAVITAISSLWVSYDTSVKNAIRKNAFFRHEKSLLEIANLAE